MKKFCVVGIMSGTSLDGLDIAYCEFWKAQDCWQYKIVNAETNHYTQEILDKISNAHVLTGIELIKLDYEYGSYIGKSVKSFIQKYKLKVDFISSHGHTVFHNPTERFTLQIGNGAFITAETGLQSISNFRLLDVALNGQGAPLVPSGEIHLFSQYDYCLNLGGFANISYTHYKKRIAYDICPVNYVINHYSRKLGFDYDKDGGLASKGIVNKPLLEKLNKLEYYQLAYPKSLGREWVEKYVFSMLEDTKLSVEDKLRTFYEHIVRQLSICFTGSDKKVLVTGGGAHNAFLITLLKKKVSHRIIIPEPELVDYKEAMIFAFLGLLHQRGEKNCLASVTGAKHDNMGGVSFVI